MVGVGVVYHLSVFQANNTGRIGFGQLRVVGDHDDQPVPGHLLEQLHHLHGRLAVQRAGWFVGQENIRVIDQGTGDGHPLHLAPRHLIGLFVHLVGQSHLFQCLPGPAVTLGLGHAGQSQG